MSLPVGAIVQDLRGAFFIIETGGKRRFPDRRTLSALSLGIGINRAPTVSDAVLNAYPTALPFASLEPFVATHPWAEREVERRVNALLSAADVKGLAARLAFVVDASANLFDAEIGRTDGWRSARVIWASADPTIKEAFDKEQGVKEQNEKEPAQKEFGEKEVGEKERDEKEQGEKEATDKDSKEEGEKDTKDGNEKEASEKERGDKDENKEFSDKEAGEKEVDQKEDGEKEVGEKDENDKDHVGKENDDKEDFEKEQGEKELGETDTPSGSGGPSEGGSTPGSVSGGDGNPGSQGKMDKDTDDIGTVKTENERENEDLRAAEPPVAASEWYKFAA